MHSLSLLAASMLPLILGPLLVEALGRGAAARSALQGAVGLAVAGVLLFHVLPHAIGVAGVGVVGSAAVGWLLSLGLHRWHQQLRSGLFWLALSGLGLHAVFDGVALFAPHAGEAGYGHTEAGLLLALAVILHRLPVAMAIWWLAGRGGGRGAALGLLAAVAAATALGFAAAGYALPLLASPAIAWVQSFIAGMLAHMISEGSPASFRPRAWWAGAAFGAALLAASFLLDRPESGPLWPVLAFALLVVQLVFLWSRAARGRPS